MKFFWSQSYFITSNNHDCHRLFFFTAISRITNVYHLRVCPRQAAGAKEAAIFACKEVSWRNGIHNRADLICLPTVKVAQLHCAQHNESSMSREHSEQRHLTNRQTAYKIITDRLHAYLYVLCNLVLSCFLVTM